MEEEEEGGGGDGGVEEGSCGATIGRLQSATGRSPVETSEAEEQHTNQSKSHQSWGLEKCGPAAVSTPRRGGNTSSPYARPISNMRPDFAGILSSSTFGSLTSPRTAASTSCSGSGSACMD